MVPVSIVIITPNKAGIIAGCIDKAMQITDDVVIVENGFSKRTMQIKDGKSNHHGWEGYGASKNRGVRQAKYNWILSIDADEIPDDQLIQTLHRINYEDTAIVYDIPFRSYLGKKQIRFGSWGRDHHIRLFHRDLVKWSQTMVHETLLIPGGVKIKKINGHIHHYSVNTITEYDFKNTYYAELSAKKYFSKGKSASIIKRYISPVFGFIKNYILYLGVLDGWRGLQIAAICFKSTRLKYRMLSRLESEYLGMLPDESKLVVNY